VISIREVAWEAAAEPRVRFRPSGYSGPHVTPAMGCVSKKDFSIKNRYIKRRPDMLSLNAFKTFGRLGSCFIHRIQSIQNFMNQVGASPH
jgi:hypothetical protein